MVSQNLSSYMSRADRVLMQPVMESSSDEDDVSSALGAPRRAGTAARRQHDNEQVIWSLNLLLMYM